MKRLEKAKRASDFNGNIENLRYLFTFIVALLHLWHNLFGGGWIFESGYLAVDFFFVLSGIFMAISLDKRPQNPFVYTLKKWKAMAWIYVSSIIVSLLVRETKSITDLIKRFFLAIPDVLGLQMSGFTSPTANGILWYVSVMLIVGFFLCFLYAKNKETFIYLLAPLFVVFGYAYIFDRNANLDATSATGGGIIPLGIVRGFAGMSLGALLREGCRKIADSGFIFRKKAKWLFSAMQILGFAIMAICFSRPHSKYDFYMIFGIVMIVLPAYLQCTLWGKISNIAGNLLVRVLGKQHTFAMYAYSSITYVVLAQFIDFANIGRVKAALLYLPILFLVGSVVSRASDFLNKAAKKEKQQ